MLAILLGKLCMRFSIGKLTIMFVLSHGLNNLRVCHCSGSTLKKGHRLVQCYFTWTAQHNYNQVLAFIKKAWSALSVDQAFLYRLHGMADTIIGIMLSVGGISVVTLFVSAQ